MSDATMELQILTPLGAVKGADGVKTKGVCVPGLLGELGILPDHIPFLTPVSAGVLRFQNENNEDRCFAIAGGFVEVSKDSRVTILSDRVLSVDEIDKDALRSEFQSCEERLKEASKSDTDTETFRALEREFNWLQAQVRLVGQDA